MSAINRKYGSLSPIHTSKNIYRTAYLTSGLTGILFTYQLHAQVASSHVDFFATGVLSSLMGPFNSIASKNMNGVPADFVGKSMFELFPKEAADFYFDRIQKAIAGDDASEYDY